MYIYNYTYNIYIYISYIVHLSYLRFSILYFYILYMGIDVLTIFIYSFIFTIFFKYRYKIYTLYFMIFLQFLGVLNQHSHHPRPGLEESFDGVGGLKAFAASGTDSGTDL